MPTLEEALNETLSAEAVEASFVHAVAGIRTTENAYVSPRDGVAHSRTRFEMPDADGAGADNRGESIASHDVLHTRAAGSDDWMTVDLPRPALGPLALLTLLYGAELEQHMDLDSGFLEVEVETSRALMRVPDSLHGTLDDIVSARPEAGVAAFPEASTARVSVGGGPLHISEMAMTVYRGGEAETFALEVHPVSARTVSIPNRQPEPNRRSPSTRWPA